MIKIYDINDKLLMQAEVTSAAKREQDMSKSDYISLSFSAAEKVILPIGAYINYTYKIDIVDEGENDMIGEWLEVQKDNKTILLEKGELLNP